MKSFILLILSFIIFFNVESQSVTLQAVLDSIKESQANDPLKSVVKIERKRNFDFEKFQVLDGAINNDDFFEIGWDKNGCIATITHHEKNPRLSNFRLLVYNFGSFIVLAPNLYFNESIKSNSEILYRPCFFLRIVTSQELYFVNFLPQFGDSNKTGMIHDSPLQIQSIKDISAIMTLDSHFFPKALFRFGNGRLIYGSIMLYETGTNKLMTEKLFINTELLEYSLDDLLFESSHFNRLIYENVFITNIKPRISPEKMIYPLWNWLGTHQYLSSN